MTQSNIVSLARVLTLCAAGLFLAGCAVTTGKVTAEAEKRTTEIVAAKKQIDVLAKRPEPLKRIAGNYVGGQAMAVSHSLSLPPNAREVVLNFGAAYGSLSDIARNIRAATRIPVRINSDVGTGKGAATEAPAAMPLPGGPLPPRAAASGGELPLKFTGDLSDYLNQITGILGVNWEYANGEIHIFRRVTRVFTLLISPGSLAVRDDVNSGSTSGGSASGVQVQAGSFNSSSNASTNSNYNPWDAVDQVLKAMISSEGRYTVNQASGSLVVTDSKEVVERVADWVRQENSSLTRQVAIEVREIAVQTNTNTQLGVDLNLVYQKLNAGTGLRDWAFRFGAPSTMTDAGAGSIGFNIARADARLSGSNVAVQALNTLGNIVLDTTRTLITTNRVPVRMQDVTDRAYLAETTPSSGGLTGASGPGLPGLKPGVVTYGDNLIVVPTIGEAESVILQMFSTRSALVELNSVSAGEGATFQQINTPVISRKKNSQNFQVAQGETLVIVGNNADSWSSKDAHSITGGSTNATQTRTINVLLVTTRILAGL